MAKDNVIRMDRAKRLADAARAYMESVQTVLQEPERALPVLIRALPLLDEDLIRQVILLLGSFPGHEVGQCLLNTMTAPSLSEEIRHAAAVQLSVMVPMMKDPGAILESLLAELNHPDPERRRNGAVSLGWNGNTRAAGGLVALLNDPDPEVQQAAVDALINLCDDSSLELILERLRNGSAEQKRNILFNLWRFSRHRDRVSAVYLDHLEHPVADFRSIAMTFIGAILDPGDAAEAYRKKLHDSDAQVRLSALFSLSKLPMARTPALEADMRSLLKDPDPKIRQEATRYLGLKRR